MLVRTLPLIIAAGLALSACDQIRMPGAEEENPPIVTEPQAPPTPLPSGETPPVIETTQPDEVDEQVEVPIDEIDTETATPITDLAAINAALCGLPVKPVDETMTIAQLTGAKPAEDLFGVSTINGTAASLTDFPGLVKMEPREILPGGAIASGHCGATRIASNWFITAAHCLDDDYDEVQLIAGAETITSPLAKKALATASVCHAAYGGAGNNYVNDIALVRVADDMLPLLTDVPIARYGATEAALVPFNYAEARMAGWGLTNFRGQLSSTLLSAKLTMTGAGPAAIGVKSLDGAGPCVGDSGGPLFVDEADGSSTVVGVLSVVEQNTETREFCEGEYGARYTNLQGYSTWIEAVMQSCDSGAGLCGY